MPTIGRPFSVVTATLLVMRKQYHGEALIFAAPTPHSAPNAQTSPEYIPRPFDGHNGPFFNSDFFAYNFAALTPAIPENDRQSFYGSFTRDLCDKYLTVFADFKYTRSFFNAALAPTPFTPDPFHTALGTGFSPTGISVPIQNAFNPFTVPDTFTPADSPQPGIPVTTGVKYRSLEAGNRTSPTTKHDMLFDFGLKGEMGEFGDYFKTWNWELGFRYSRDEAINLSEAVVSAPGLREALLDTDPATAFNPFLGFNGVNQQTAIARSRVYVTLHDTAIFETPSAYFNLNGDLFQLPAGPVSFAVGAEYRGERFRDDPDSLNTTFNTIGATDLEASKVNRDVWGFYQEVRIPVTSPTWNFPGAYSLEFDLAEREEWYSQNTSAVPPAGVFVFQPAVSTQYNAQRPKFSVRWQPLDPKWIGGLTLRASYSEGFHAPTLSEITPASSQNFPIVADPFSKETEPQIEERILGNPHTHPEVAYEWSYGAVYSPKWLKGLTLSADWWHIDMRDIVTALGSQFILDSNPPTPGVQQQGPLVFRGAGTPDDPNGPALLVIDPSANLAGAVFEGLDYEGIYIFDLTNFGGPDVGRFTYTINGTWLSRARLQPLPDTKPFNINGQFVPTSFNLTSSLPWNRFNVSLFYDGPANTWMAGFDAGVIVHYIGQYNDDNFDLTSAGVPGLFGIPAPKRQQPATGILPNRARKIDTYTTFDLIASYTFNLPAPVAQQEVAGYSKDGGKNVRMKDGKEKNVMPVSTAAYNECGWRAWLNGVTVSAGLQNVLDSEPPFVAGSFENGYDESLTTIKGRFWYVGLRKRF